MPRTLTDDDRADRIPKEHRTQILFRLVIAVWADSGTDKDFETWFKSDAFMAGASLGAVCRDMIAGYSTPGAYADTAIMKAAVEKIKQQERARENERGLVPTIGTKVDLADVLRRAFDHVETLPIGTG